MTLPSDPCTGRRKTSVARVRIKAGSGNFVVNGKPVEEFFTTLDSWRAVTRPLEVTDTVKSYDIWVKVSGGGITGQADAVSLGIARALKADNPDFEHILREHGLLTRDPRMVERKKYGLHKARKATQFSKR